MMIEKALDEDGKRIFQDGDKASLRREIEVTILEEIQLAMINLVLIRRWRRLKPILKANSDWKFIFSLAKELHKTVADLCETLTIEEMIGWAAFFELNMKNKKNNKNKHKKLVL